MKRGFKSLCESLAVSYRNKLGLSKKEPLCPRQLAKHLNVLVLSPKKIDNFSEEDMNVLLHEEQSSWSAVALSLNSRNAIIYNSSHALSRQSNDIMHELSHIILEHKPTGMHSYEIGVVLRYYDKNQEEEADCLAATLLLPRDVLFDIKFSGTDLKTAAENYNISTSLLNMRLNTSGINTIHRRTKKKTHRFSANRH